MPIGGNVANRDPRPATVLLPALSWTASSQGQAREAPVVTSLTLFAGTARGLFRSRDWGAGFESVVGRSPGERLDGLGGVGCIAPQGPPVLVGADSGVYFSPDFGETWRRISDTGPCDALLGSRYPLADRTLFLAGPQGLLRSVAEVFTPEDAPRGFSSDNGAITNHRSSCHQDRDDSSMPNVLAPKSYVS